MAEKATVTNSTPEILIVDDNTFNVYSLKLIIEEAFFLPCDSAYSAKEAFQLIKDRLVNGKGVYSLILTDINMPEIDGLQMSKMIKTQLQMLKSDLQSKNGDEELKDSLYSNTFSDGGPLRVAPDNL